MKRPSGSLSAFLIAFFVTVGAVSTPSAQQPAAGQARPSDKTASPGGTMTSGQASTSEAPVVQFAFGGIGIDEAIALTFKNDPNLHRQDATVQFHEGVVQEQRGPFDMTLLSSLDTNHRTQELTQSRKQSEIDKRTKLDNQISSNQTAVANAR